MSIQIQPLGDLAVLVSFGESISTAIHDDIQQFLTRLKREKINGMIEWVPTYNKVAIYYQPEIISYKMLLETITRIYHSLGDEEKRVPVVYELPVYYGGETGPDLTFMAEYLHLPEEEVIALHANREYLIYMMGFVPGFPYLGGLSERLTVPRLEHPKPSVPAGSVGIGGSQTGIYPAEVPSGWRIIGITPVKLFDMEREEPFLLSAGNYIKFSPIDLQEYVKIKQLVEENKYNVTTYLKEEGETHEMD